jgi:L-iditol 2-dehydrogenase
VSQGNVLAAPEVRDFGALALVEPLACVLRGSRACAIAPGDLVVIYGAGPIGLLHLRVAQLRSPRAVVVCQPSGERQAPARQWGADHVVDPFMDELPVLIGELSAGQGADVIIVATPAPKAQEQALRLAAPGARINLFAGLPTDHVGITIDSNLIHYKELILTGSTANTTEDCREALELVRTGAIDTARLISRRYSLAEGHAAMQAAAAREVLKAVLEP